MASDMATRRLRKELMAIKRTPVDNIVVSYLNDRILVYRQYTTTELIVGCCFFLTLSTSDFLPVRPNDQNVL